MARTKTIEPTRVVHNRETARDRKKPEQDFGESLTVEGETFTIQELFARSAARGDINAELPDSAFLDADLEQINQMHRAAFDLTDIADHAEHVKKLDEFVKDAHARAQAELEKQNSQNSTISEEKTDSPE